MSEKKKPEGQGEFTPVKAPEPVAESAAEPQGQEIKNWQFWVTKLGADYPLARGTCVSLKADWDSAIGEKEFIEALKKFGGEAFGIKKSKAGKK